MSKKFILVEPHILEQLQLLSSSGMDLNSQVHSPGEATTSPENAPFHRPGESMESTRRQPLEDAGNILSLRSQGQHESPENITSQRRGNNLNEKYACSLCGHTFARKQNCRRHMALIHDMDISDNPIDSESLTRYKGYNRRRKVLEYTTQRRSESEEDEEYFRRHPKNTLPKYIKESYESEDEPRHNYLRRHQWDRAMEYGSIDSDDSMDESCFNATINKQRLPARIPTRKNFMRKSCTPQRIKWLKY